MDRVPAPPRRGCDVLDRRVVGRAISHGSALAAGLRWTPPEPVRQRLERWALRGGGVLARLVEQPPISGQ
jgi:hypothetical protein